MIKIPTQRTTWSRRILILGCVLAVLVASSLMLAAGPAQARDFTVTSTNDSGAGSLRQAITDANTNSGPDRIAFNIRGSGVKTIRPGSRLPQITDAVTIDGYTQPGAKPNSRSSGGTDAVLLVELDGTSVTNGLFIVADDVVVRGLVINRFSETHIIVRGSDSRIEGNFIGPDVTGTIDLGGGDDGGVSVNSSFGNRNTIGGTSPKARNLVSGNDRAGVFLSGTEDTRVEGNLIGTSKDGKGNLGNGAGVAVISASGNTVGGAAPGAANTIAFNETDGVVAISDSLNNRIFSNSIFSNGEEGIDLGADGRTDNDDKDPDSGPNNLQNFPLLTSAKASRKGTTIVGKLNSTANTAFTVQFFSNPSATDEGKTFLGQKNVTTDGNGDAAISFSTRKRASGVMMATATDPAGSTSEFSASKNVVRQR